MSAIVACSSDDEPVPPGTTAGITSGEYKGELGGQGETGVLDVTLSGGGLKPSALRELDTQDQATAVGTVTVQGHGTFQLTGTFDPDTGVLTLSGGGYTFSGKVAGDGISGTYTGPYGSGSFTLIKGSGAQIFCGTYTGQDDGIWNLVVGPTSAGGSVANTKGTYSSPMACSVSGANLSCTASGGVTATGAVSGATASGTWSDGSGHSGTWTGATAACPVPVTPVPDAGGTDAHAPPVDASGVDASGHDAAGGPDAANDAQGAHDTGAPDAGPDAVATDASGAVDSSSGDAATATDASGSVDASGGADSSTVDAAVTDSGSLDAGSSTADAGATDAAIVDAGQCPHIVDIQTVTQLVYIDPAYVTQLGVGTINYPININTSASVCPGVTRIEASLGSNPNTWTDIGACTGKGAGPNTYCFGVTIPTSFLAAVDTLKLRAVNPGVNQGTESGTIAIAAGNPTPVVTGGNTANLVANGVAQQLTLTGTGFTGHSTAEADVSGIDAGVATIPAVISFTSTSITLEFSAAFTATPQPYFLVKVINPGTPAPLFGYWGQSIRVQ